MLRRVSRSAAAVLLGLLALSCTRLPSAATVSRDAFEPLAHADSIPLAWGRLIAVNENSTTPSASLLWFQDEAGEIRMVGFNHSTGRFWTNARVIRRH